MAIKSLDQLKPLLQQRRGNSLPLRQWMVRSAVTMLLTRTHPTSIVLIRRAIREGDPWSGDMSLPGGRKEKSDKNTFETAIRETQEEIGLDLHKDGQFLGRLSDVMTRAHEANIPMAVTPFVFEIADISALQLSDEAKAIVSVPLEFLGNNQNRETMVWQQGLMRANVPCYHYEGHRIWGLTLIMLDELIRLAGGEISRWQDWARLVGLR